MPVTKRSILKFVAGMYDSLGIISPVVVSIKVLFQELCEKGVGWEEELKEGERKRWIGWLEDLRRATEIAVPRSVYRMPQGEINYFLHGFTDASIKAYQCRSLFRV